MRDIKFRAWDKDRKRMMFDCKWVEYRHSKDGTMIAVNYDRSGNERQLEVLQYTGLKDKNGSGSAYLYEGDIISDNGKILGNIYESKEVYRKGVDHIVARMGTKEWRESESIAMGFGFNYTE